MNFVDWLRNMHLRNRDLSDKQVPSFFMKALYYINTIIVILYRLNGVPNEVHI